MHLSQWFVSQKLFTALHEYTQFRLTVALNQLRLSRLPMPPCRGSRMLVRFHGRFLSPYHPCQMAHFTGDKKNTISIHHCYRREMVGLLNTFFFFFYNKNMSGIYR